MLPSGVVGAVPGPRSERAGALYVGRLWPHKNLPLLIDAFAIAAERGFAGDLVIAGDGSARADVENARAAVAGRIAGARAGFGDEEQKIELLSRAAVMGMPSRREGFPRVIAEAMASGLPVVTAGFPENGAKEVVTQYGAGVVCGTEPTDFAKGLLNAEAQWDGFSQAGLAGAQSLDWSGIAATLEAHARAVAQRARRTTGERGRTKMRIMVTGGAGFVGRELVPMLSAKAEVLVADLLRYGTPDWLTGDDAGFAFQRVDIRDAAATRAVIEEFAPDVIVHLAAIHYIPECDSDPPNAVATNVTGTVNLLAAARRESDSSSPAVERSTSRRGSAP